MREKWTTYIEELDVVQDLIVESKVVAGDDVDASILLDLPVGKTEPLSLSLEVVLGQFAAPVRFVGLFEVTKDSHAGKAQN